MDVLIVVDMQKDFVDGALGTKEAVKIVPNVVKKVKNFKGKIYFTRDTHPKTYLDTQEGHNLPVEHCIEGTEGWEIIPELKKYAKTIVNKPTFGSLDLVKKLTALNKKTPIDSITVIGLCTDICVISNAMILKAAFTEVPIIIDSKCCAGVTPKSHRNALSAMQVCQIAVK